MKHLQTFESFSYGGSYATTNEEYIFGWIKNWVNKKIEKSINDYLESPEGQERIEKAKNKSKVTPAEADKAAKMIKDNAAKLEKEVKSDKELTGETIGDGESTNDSYRYRRMNEAAEQSKIKTVRDRVEKYLMGLGLSVVLVGTVMAIIDGYLKSKIMATVVAFSGFTLGGVVLALCGAAVLILAALSRGTRGGFDA
jgi:hypothetical protein